MPHRREQSSTPIDRRSFLKSSGAASIAPLLATAVAGSCAAPGRSAASPNPGPGLGDDYVVKGLTGLARACDQPGWFQAHWGAAVLAAHYLCVENDLAPRLVRAIRTQADALLAKHATYFRPLAEGRPDDTRIDEVARALEQPIDGLRAHGHAVTFGALALRALGDAPELATPAVIDGLCKISRRIGRKRPLPDHDHNRRHPLPPYEGERSIAEALCECVLRFENVRYPPASAGGARRPNFTHQLTYTDALIQLHRMGYDGLARRGYEAHRVYVNNVPDAALPKDRPMHPWARFDVVLSPGFWEFEPHVEAWSRDFDSRSNRMGEWLVGHVFKGSYSLARVRRLVRGSNRVERFDQVVLERVVDATVAGG